MRRTQAALSETTGVSMRRLFESRIRWHSGLPFTIALSLVVAYAQAQNTPAKTSLNSQEWRKLWTPRKLTQADIWVLGNMVVESSKYLNFNRSVAVAFSAIGDGKHQLVMTSMSFDNNLRIPRRDAQIIRLVSSKGKVRVAERLPVSSINKTVRPAVPGQGLAIAEALRKIGVSPGCVSTFVISCFSEPPEHGIRYSKMPLAYDDFISMKIWIKK